MNSPHSDRSPEPLPLVVGIGSSHGDDQAGWAAADALATIACQHAVIRKASVPVDLLNWLDQVDELHIVDVCQVEGNLQMLQAVYRWDWSQLPTATGTGTVDATDQLSPAREPAAVNPAAVNPAGAVNATERPRVASEVASEASQQAPPDTAIAPQAQNFPHSDGMPAAAQPVSTPIDNSHGFDVLSVLHLARELGRLPATVILWAIPGTCFDAAAELSPQIRDSLPSIAQQIATELHHA